MLSIGEFARLAGVSVRMLRHYDQLGLLRPAQVDPWSGYRRYDAAQLDRANQLVALKDLGFSLDQVGELLAGDLPDEQVATLLRARRAELRASLAADQVRLLQIEARLRTIEKEAVMAEQSYVETELPALNLAQLSTRVEDLAQVGEQIGPMFQQVIEAVTAAGIGPQGPSVGVYTAEGDGMLIAAGEQIDGPVPSGLEHAELRPVPRALTARYAGPDLTGIQAAWQSLVQEAERRGLTPYGPCREVYEATPFAPGGTGWVIDLQQPVR